MINVPDGRKKHECSICQKEFYWNSESKWYGILEDEDGKQIVKLKVCSDKCFELSEKMHLPDDDDDSRKLSLEIFTDLMMDERFVKLMKNLADK